MQGLSRSLSMAEHLPSSHPAWDIREAQLSSGEEHGPRPEALKGPGGIAKAALVHPPTPPAAQQG